MHFATVSEWADVSNYTLQMVVTAVSADGVRSAMSADVLQRPRGSPRQPCCLTALSSPPCVDSSRPAAALETAQPRADFAHPNRPFNGRLQPQNFWHPMRTLHGSALCLPYKVHMAVPGSTRGR